ncbi:MAG: hypothetical protein IKA32_07685 [Lentisphaeria bacterium]|nr:hypothetical protein [Lentisphaeria bacterium]
MTIEEFKSNLRNADVEISDADFEKIHTVYQFHPLAESKKDIANLFELGGMMLINDMLPRAKAIGQAEREMLAAKRQYEELNAKYMELKRA